jgi:hypothetical protein
MASGSRECALHLKSPLECVLLVECVLLRLGYESAFNISKSPAAFYNFFFNVNIHSKCPKSLNFENLCQVRVQSLA